MKQNKQQNLDGPHKSFDRRSLLKQASATGVIVGVGTFGTGQVVAEKDQEGGRDQQEGEVMTGTLPFIEFRLSVPYPDNGLITARSKEFPAYIKAPRGIYIPNNPPSDLTSSTEGANVATSHGIKQINEGESITKWPVPLGETLTGRGRHLAHSDISPDISLRSMDRNTAEFGIGSDSIEVKENQTKTKRFSASLKFYADSEQKTKAVEAEATLAFRGDTEHIAHSNLILIPKESRGGKHIKQKMRPEMKKRGKIGKWEDIKSMDEVGAWGIKVLNKGGK
jgi:hypothetical protein